MGERCKSTCSIAQEKPNTRLINSNYHPLTTNFPPTVQDNVVDDQRNFQRFEQPNEHSL
ncbi:hypothetical protein J6590_025235 [Homalodisca vitripennis]|nr:hypothetical protein J6590_025235 [Homalodisca vitripennis]